MRASSDVAVATPKAVEEVLSGRGADGGIGHRSSAQAAENVRGGCSEAPVRGTIFGSGVAVFGERSPAKLNNSFEVLRPVCDDHDAEVEFNSELRSGVQSQLGKEAFEEDSLRSCDGGGGQGLKVGRVRGSSKAKAVKGTRLRPWPARGPAGLRGQRIKGCGAESVSCEMGGADVGTLHPVRSEGTGGGMFAALREGIDAVAETGIAGSEGAPAAGVNLCPAAHRVKGVEAQSGGKPSEAKKGVEITGDEVWAPSAAATGSSTSVARMRGSPAAPKRGKTDFEKSVLQVLDVILLANAGLSIDRS